MQNLETLPMVCNWRRFPRDFRSNCVLWYRIRCSKGNLCSLWLSISCILRDQEKYRVLIASQGSQPTHNFGALQVLKKDCKVGEGDSNALATIGRHIE